MYYYNVLLFIQSFICGTISSCFVVLFAALCCQGHMLVSERFERDGYCVLDDTDAKAPPMAEEMLLALGLSTARLVRRSDTALALGVSTAWLVRRSGAEMPLALQRLLSPAPGLSDCSFRFRSVARALRCWAALGLRHTGARPLG